GLGPDSRSVPPGNLDHRRAGPEPAAGGHPGQAGRTRVPAGQAAALAPGWSLVPGGDASGRAARPGAGRPAPGRLGRYRQPRRAPGQVRRRPRPAFRAGRGQQLGPALRRHGRGGGVRGEAVPAAVDGAARALPRPRRGGRGGHVRPPAAVRPLAGPAQALASRRWFHSATRSAWAASRGPASPSMAIRSILSPACTAFTTAWSASPSTSPKTVWRPSSQGVATWVMKNWLPLVPGPALAMDSLP